MNKQTSLTGNIIKNDMPILTAKVGNNADLFPDVLKIYAIPGCTIADVTYGNGNFWKQIEQNKYKLLTSDLKKGIKLSELPYSDESIDVFVLDPPYAHSSSTPIKPSIAKTYNLNSISGRKRIRELYIKGSTEAFRVLKREGILIIKCQDEIESGKQHWNHIELITEISTMGFLCEDLFILVQEGIPTMRHKNQFHARKNHSYFVVFRKKGCVKYEVQNHLC